MLNVSHPALLRKDVQQRTSVNWLLIESLDELVHYRFGVQAETSAGLGAERWANVSTGYNPGIIKEVYVSPGMPAGRARAGQCSVLTPKWRKIKKCQENT